MEEKPVTQEEIRDLLNQNGSNYEPLKPDFAEEYRGCVERGVLNSIKDVRRENPKGGLSYLHKGKQDRKRYSFL